MIAVLAALLVVVAALGLQLAMVVGVLPPGLALAFLGYGGVFVGMVLVVPAAIRRAQAAARRAGAARGGDRMAPAGRGDRMAPAGRGDGAAAGRGGAAAPSDRRR